MRRRNARGALLCLLLMVSLLLASCGGTAPVQPTPSAAEPATTPSPVPPTATPTLGPPVPEPVEPVTGMPQGDERFPWWNHSVFYEIFVRSFYDSDGDGIGDFNGIIEKLDYLNDGEPKTDTDLGVTALWLMPIFPAASYHGYDATDYYSVNPEYGTMEDFKRLLDEAHARGMRVIIDLMLNHTSREHPWFVEAQNPDSPYRDWYIWAEEPQGRGPDGQVVWHPAPSGGYYYGLFWDGMPDLNFTNPDVTSEMQEVARFWLEDVGVDGFRLDGARYLVETEQALADSDANHAWFQEFNTFVKGVNPEAVLVGEVWTTTFTVVTYIKGGELDTAFAFDQAAAILSSLNFARAETALDQMALDARLYPEGQLAPFLTNHDQNRVMSELGDQEEVRHAAAMLLTAWGTPFIYYGEEIGMTGVKPDERIRTPMQWAGGDKAGFTTGTPWQPVSQTDPAFTVEAQSEDPDSLLSFYRRLVKLRSENIALRVGQPYFLEIDPAPVYALLRASPEEAVLVVLNLGKEAVSEYNLSLESGPLQGRYRVVDLLGAGEFPDLEANAEGGFDQYLPLPELPPNGRLILQLQPVGR